MPGFFYEELLLPSHLVAALFQNIHSKV